MSQPFASPVTMASSKLRDWFPSPRQAGVDKYLNYYDIMILGKTGTGKTTTADKLLIANPTGKDYSYVPPEQDPSTAACDDESAGTTPGKNKASSNTYQDISMWSLSNAPDNLETTTLRLKNLVFCRSLEEPHEEICKLHMEESKTTDVCELLSNDTSKVRVMDLPGFFGSNAARFTKSLPPTSTSATTMSERKRTKSNVHRRVQTTTETDLCTMRKIIHIKMAMKFKSNRIVYFLPETGVLVRDSQVLKIEIAIMEHFFGRSIFECMVAVATHNSSCYRSFRKDIDLYPPEDIAKTKLIFQAALSEVFDGDDIPEPPIIFISLNDTCDEVLRKIKECQVVREGVNLCFNPSTCARCNIKIATLKDKFEKKRMKKDNNTVIAACTHDSWSSAIPYEESTCHPMMIPKYTTIERVMGGIAHLVTFMAFKGKWPSFGNFEEICINCKDPPNEHGCLRIGTKYIHRRSRGTITVGHSSNVEESFVIDLNPDDEPWDDDEETVLVMGTEKDDALLAKLMDKWEKQTEKIREHGEENINH